MNRPGTTGAAAPVGTLAGDAGGEAASVTVRLRDGRDVRVRPIRPDDGDRLVEFHSRLSPETVRRRYFTAHPILSADELHRYTHVDGHTRLAFVAVIDEGGGEAIVGVGRYESMPEAEVAEVAFVVRDDLQGLGLGGHLVELIARAAARHGKTRVIAETLPENQAMRRAMRRAGPDPVSVFRDGIVEVTVAVS